MSYPPATKCQEGRRSCRPDRDRRMEGVGGLRVGCHCILIDLLWLIYTPSIPVPSKTPNDPNEPKNIKKRQVVNGCRSALRDLSQFLKKSSFSFKKIVIGPWFRGQHWPTEAPSFKSSLGDERFGGHWTPRIDKLTQDFFQRKFHFCHTLLFPTVHCLKSCPTSGSMMEIFSHS